MFPGVFLYHWLLIGVHNFLCTLDDFLHYLRIQVVLFSLILLHDVVLSLTFVWFVFCPASWSSAASWQLQVGPCQLQVGPCQLCCVVVRCARAYTWSTRETAHRHYTHQETGTALVRNKKLTHTHTHTHLTALFPGLPRWAGTRKVKPI